MEGVIGSGTWTHIYLHTHTQTARAGLAIFINLICDVRRRYDGGLLKTNYSAGKSGFGGRCMVAGQVSGKKSKMLPLFGGTSRCFVCFCFIGMKTRWISYLVILSFRNALKVRILVYLFCTRP